MGNAGSIQLGKKISVGASSEIFLPKDEEKWSNIVIKKVSKKFRDFGKREAIFLSDIDHPNILKLIDYYEHRSCVYIVLEKMDDDMFEYMEKRDKNLVVGEIRDFFSQICSAFKYLHETQRIAHRDLKLENILISLPNKILKLCDFGFATEEKFANERCGSPGYIAPEVLKYEPHFSRPLDIWALGVVLYIFTYRNSPFILSPSEDNQDICNNILKNQPSYKFLTGEETKVPQDLTTLIQSLLTSDPITRPQIKTVLTSPFLTKSEEDVVVPGLVVSES